MLREKAIERSAVDSQILLEAGRLFSNAGDVHFIARSLALMLMGRNLASKCAVLLRAPDESTFTLAYPTGSTSKEEPHEITVPSFAEKFTSAIIHYPAELADDTSKNEAAGPAGEFQQDIEHFFQEVLGLNGVDASAGMMLSPLVSDHRLIGLLLMGPRQDGTRYDQQDGDWIENLCRTASIAFQNAWFRQRLEYANIALERSNRALDQKVHELETLYEVSREFGAQLQRPRIASILRLTLLGQFRIQRFLMLSRSERGIEIIASSGLKDLPTGIELDGLFALHTPGRASGQVPGRVSGRASDLDSPESMDPPLFIPCRDEALKAAGIAGFVAIYQDDKLAALAGLGARSNGEEFRDEDLHLVRSISNLALLSIDKTQLVDEMMERSALLEEIHVARKIQVQLLPDPLPAIDGLDVAAVNVPSKEVGGDYYDLAETPDGNHVAAIGDVSGKGIPASLLMANLQAMLHILLPVDISLSEAMGRINDLLVRNTPPDRFITFFLAKYFRQNSELHYINAGHNPPLLLRRDSETPEWLEDGGMLLGALPTLAAYGTGVTSLQTGDILVMYTDGVTEAMNPEGDEEFGVEGLLKSIFAARNGSASSILNALRADVDAFSQGHRSDDLTLVVLKKI